MGAKFVILLHLILNISLLLAYDIKYTDKTVSLSPFPIDVGRNVFHSRQAWPDNEYYDTYTEDPDVGRTTEEYVLSRNFKFEEYHVTTRDGYILPIYRIVNPYNKNKKPYPVLFGTSFFLDVNQWLWSYGGVAVPPKDPANVKEGQILNSNLPYALSNHGYDVWLFNPRGVGDSLNHTHLSIYSLDYWKFSLDEVAQYDIPAVVEYVRSATKHKTIGYIGYSQGSTFILMAMTLQPKLNEVIKPLIIMGFGVVPPKDSGPHPLELLVAVTLNQVALPLFPKFQLTGALLTAICAPPVQEACAYLLQVITGFDSPNINRTRFPVYLSQLPAGTSSWTFAHFGQLFNRNCLSMFSYGEAENERQYGQVESPCYNTTKITNRFIGAFIGKNDQRTPYNENVLSLLGAILQVIFKMAPHVAEASGTFKPVSHVIFDMDGLLLDTEDYYTLAMDNITKKYGKPFTWEVKIKMMGLQALDAAKVAIQELDLPIKPEQFMSEVDVEYPKVFPLCQFMPGAERLLEHLKTHNIPCCIASSSKRVSFELKTAKYGVKFDEGYYFQHILLASNDPEVKHSKPAPDTFLIAAQRFKESPKPEDCLVFEDSVAGVLAGCRAGMQTIMVPDPRLDIDEARQAQPDFNPVEILESLEQFRPEQYGLPPF
ncbi:(DL)-glycerol-3-phosphatase 2 [Halotydeus destructor]|nr:(DL)-glycerol-3-phosphatase 2 [Halotydeus destructor]